MKISFPMKKFKIFTNICLFILVGYTFISYTASANIELSVIRPLGEFVTNNKELTVEGFVKCSKDQIVSVSVNTPAGVSNLGELKNTLKSITVDIGSSQSMTALIFTPAFKEDLSLAPRVVKLASSENGQNFEDKGLFNCTSGMGQDYGEARIDFNGIIKSRYIKINIIDGWQKEKVSIYEVNFIDISGKTIKGKIINVEIGFMDEDIISNETGIQVHFQLDILLKEGENHIFISSKAIDTKKIPNTIEEDSLLVKAIYISEVIIKDKPITLSDGYKAELTIPSETLSSNLKKINIIPIDVKQIEWTTYADNRSIVKGTLPVLAYKFDMGLKTPFYATAKDSLERQLPNLAVDGNTEYPSTWITALSPLPVWIKIDLRSINNIGKIIITARVSGKISYSPKKLTVLVSIDDKIYDEVATIDNFNDKTTEIPLITTPSARYVKLLIEEGKQGNNIQINEIEFRDSEGTKIVAYTQIDSTVLMRPAKLTLYYDETDLASANIKSEKNLAIFGWNEKLKEWQFIGGKLDTVKNSITVNLNYLSTFAIFEAYPQTISIRWNYNPFSPNGDGIADTTTLNINLGQETISQAKVEIFTYTGKLVRTLIQEEGQSGNISILWDGKDENGDGVEIGPYIYQITIGKKVHNGVLVVAR
ncbi:TPA: hypothetical protein ENX78_19180 [Candidatus Poribacteria bacterium]|nr:hypothetical protein [Candidatus Poribacteria bacterium]